MKLKNKNNFLAKIIIFVWTVLFIFAMLGLIVEASPTILIEPQNGEHFELRATTIEEKRRWKASNYGTLGAQYRF